MAKSKPIIVLGEGENIPLNRLRLSAENVRKIYDKDAIADMADDIRTNGLIQSLSVKKLDTPEGDIVAEVIGGGRRFRALELLAKKNELAADAPIPCVPNDRQIAAQISLAENTQREQLHPLDEFRACASMQSKGKSEEDIADALRMPLKTVKQRLRMANASPTILKAFADGKIKLPTLMAFCVTENHERQEQVWGQIKNGGYMAEWALKERLMEDTVPTSDKRVKYVGLANYEKNGGVVERDLFDDNNQGYIKDVDLLNQMVQAKLERAAEKHKAEGWNFAIVAPTVSYAETQGFDQLTPANATLTAKEQKEFDALETERDELQEIPAAEFTKKQAKRLEALTEEIDAIENREPVYSAEDMARGGITVEIDSNGKLRVERGFIKPADTGGGAENGANAPASRSATEAEDEGSAKLPDSLVTDLTQFRTAALQAALLEKPEVAFVATLHAMAMSALNMYGTESCLQLRATTDFPHQAEGLKEFGPMKRITDLRKAWMTRLPRDSVKLWEAIEALTKVEQMQLLAFLAASTISVVVQKHDQRSNQVNHSQVLVKALDYDIRKDWMPTADNFFRRVTKAAMLVAVAEAKDADTAELLDNAKLKKVGMAAEAERLTQGTGWLPAPMRAEAPIVEEDGNFNETEEDGEDLPDFLQDGGAEGGTSAAA